MKGESEFFSLSEVWALVVEGIVKEADKLACLVIFLLFQVSQYCKGTFFGGQCRWAMLTQRGNSVRHPIYKFPGFYKYSVMEAARL